MEKIPFWHFYEKVRQDFAPQGKQLAQLNPFKVNSFRLDWPWKALSRSK